MLKFCEFLHQIRVIFYLRFEARSIHIRLTPRRTKIFAPNPPNTLSKREGSSSFFQLELPSSVKKHLCEFDFSVIISYKTFVRYGYENI